MQENAAGRSAGRLCRIRLEDIRSNPYQPRRAASEGGIAELEKRRAMGKKVAVAAVAVGLSAALTGCVMKGVVSNKAKETQAPETVETTDEPEELQGEPIVLEGEIALPPDESEEPPELLGDVAEIPESGETDE